MEEPRLVVPSGTVERIDDFLGFARLHEDWDTLWALDGRSEIFTSWSWLRGAFTANGRKPLVLAFRIVGEPRYAAFLPLAADDRRIRGITIRRELYMAGDPVADFTGMVCRPDREEQAIDAFAAYLHADQRWEKLFATNLLDERVDHLVRRFDPARYRVVSDPPMSCVYVPLPSSWEEYLRTRVGSNSRDNLRRRMRQVEALPGFRTSSPDRGSLDEHIETLLVLRHGRWGGDLAVQRRQFGALFRSAFEDGILSLMIHWSGTTPVVAIAGFIDRRHGVYASYISGWNPDYARISPGMAIFGYTIRYAIESGLTVYDFLRGGDSYKSAFGGEERSTTFHVVERRTARAALSTSIETLAVHARRIVGATR